MSKLQNAHKYNLGNLVGDCLALLSLLNNAELNTLTARKGDPGLRTLSDCEHVTHSSGKLVSCGVSDVDDVKASFVLLTMLNNPNTPSVAPTSNHDDVTNVELNKLYHLSCLKVDFDCIVGLDKWVWVPVTYRPSSINISMTKHYKFRCQHFTAGYMFRGFIHRDRYKRYLIVRPSKVVM